MVRWHVLEILRQLLIKRNQMMHIKSEEIVASQSIVLKLFSVDVYVVLLCLFDEMHELCLSVREGSLLVGLQLIVYQVLIAVVHLLSFETHKMNLDF